ncbi:MAG: sugar transporter permease [Paenibacillus sp.]|nr:sugar transporter permease [Paenibacillus sp.]
MNSLHRKLGDKVFDIWNTVFFCVVLAIILYPLYFMLVASFSDPVAVNNGQTYFLPQGISLEGYLLVFQNENILTGYKNSIIYTIIGTVVKVSLTISAAYVLSRKDVPGKNLFTFLFVFTMFFHGGLIPTYLLVKQLNLVNTMWALILPGAVPVYYLIITRTFFQTTISDDLLEASQMDGCSDWKFFFRIVLPLSMPIIAVIALFSAVQEWNSYFKALLYLQDWKKQPLQVVLRQILVQSQVDVNMITNADAANAREKVAEQIKYALIIFASVPMLVLYPFVQRYFVKGIMIGSLKG